MMILNSLIYFNQASSYQQTRRNSAKSPKKRIVLPFYKTYWVYRFILLKLESSTYANGVLIKII